MFKIRYTLEAIEDIDFFRNKEKNKLNKISKIIDDIKFHPYIGIGHPEPLKYEYKGYWSRHIDKKNRLVYRVKDEIIEIVKLRYHYNDK